MSLKTSISLLDLEHYVVNQLNNYFPDGDNIKTEDIHKSAKYSFERIEHCFSFINNKYFFDGESSVFDHLHGDQYAMWLYILSNELFKEGGCESISKKLFLLNKSLHSCDVFYEVELPSVFLLVHPLGTVLGRGPYSDFFIAYQRCGVGSNHDKYPSFGTHVTLHPGSSVLGDCYLENNTCLGAESLLLDKSLKKNTAYYGNPKSFFIKNYQPSTSIWRV